LPSPNDKANGANYYWFSGAMAAYCLEVSLHKQLYMPSNDPLHGKTLEMILNELVHHFGWEDLGSIIKINCFISNPSINSSLKFLRKTPWARKKVEELYVKSMV
jgi:uncharacterized protein (DUF2132 family)